MLHHVALVETNASEEHSASIIMVTRIGELGTLLVTRATRLNIPEEGIHNDSSFLLQIKKQK
jgi:hypothetical protein